MERCDFENTEKEVWSGVTHPMLLPESSCVGIPSFRSVAPMICLAKESFWLFFWPVCTGKGVAILAN